MTLSTRQRFLAAITDHWGGLDLSSFSNRLLLQKRMFFTKMMGINLGYPHSWYIRGPYSPTLTRDAYAIHQARQSGGLVAPTLSPQIVQRLDDIQTTFGSIWKDPHQLELLASVLYLARALKTDDPSVLADRLTALKGHFTRDEASDAVAWLSEHGFLNFGIEKTNGT